VHSGARCPRPTVPRCAFSRALRASFGAWFVCAGVLVIVARAGRAGGALCWTSARVLAINIDASSGRSAPRTSCTVAPYSTQRTPRIACDRHQYQQWCAGEETGQRCWRVRKVNAGTCICCVLGLPCRHMYLESERRHMYLLCVRARMPAHVFAVC